MLRCTLAVPPVLRRLYSTLHEYARASLQLLAQVDNMDATNASAVQTVSSACEGGSCPCAHKLRPACAHAHAQVLDSVSYQFLFDAVYHYTPPRLEAYEQEWYNGLHSVGQRAQVKAVLPKD